MEQSKVVQSRDCPVCGTCHSLAGLVFSENIDPGRVSGLSFASRKEPEFMCHRLVECPTCDLVFADQPPNETSLAHSYHAADYDSSQEADDAARSYIEAIAPILSMIKKGRALEIGTGTGVFLEHLSNAGFEHVEGIEPSKKAIAAAPENRRLWIRKGMFNESDYAPESFDLICCFMTMEHVHDPLMVAESAMRLLRPGGVFVTVTHDRRSGLNKLLGHRSPIIDIEHMQLFSSKSISYLFGKVGYINVFTSAFSNRYAFRYWLRLCPFPSFFKKTILAIVSYIGLANYKLTLNVGNSFSVGFKPGEGAR